MGFLKSHDDVLVLQRFSRNELMLLSEAPLYNLTENKWWEIKIELMKYLQLSYVSVYKRQGTDSSLHEQRKWPRYRESSLDGEF